MFIQTETTGDPAQLRFLPGCEVLAEGTLDLCSRERAALSPLAEQLFGIPGIIGVRLDRDSIVVTRSGREWQHLKPAILGTIMQHFLSGAPMLRRQMPDGLPSAATEGDATMAGRVREALRRVIDPELGCNIVDLGLVYAVRAMQDGAVTILMTTTTPGCPATNYLKAGAGEAAGTVQDVASVDVQLTYEPRWTPEKMSPAARAQFGIGAGGGW